MTEGSSKPRRAVAVANYFTARAPPPKDIMAFGSVLQLTQHNIGEDWEQRDAKLFRRQRRNRKAVGRIEKSLCVVMSCHCDGLLRTMKRRRRRRELVK